MKRYEHIDIAKGIGILLVVFFHLPSINKLMYFNNWGGWITTFYMPLFFTLSGLFIKPDKPLKRIKRLMVPYVSFYAIGYAYEAVKTIAKNGQLDLMDFFAPFFGATLGYANTPVWFLLSLAEMSLIVYVLLRYLPDLLAFVVSVVLGIAGYYCGKYNVLQPYYVNVSLMCMPFFLGGFFFKDFLLRKQKYPFVGIALLLMSWFLYLPNTPSCNVSQCYISCSMIQFALVSSLATIGIVLLSGDISKYMKFTSNALSYYGANSLIVLCTHMLFVNIPGLINKILHINSLSIIIGFFIILLVEIPVIKVINQRFKILISK